MRVGLPVGAVEDQAHRELVHQREEGAPRFSGWEASSLPRSCDARCSSAWATSPISSSLGAGILRGEIALGEGSRGLGHVPQRARGHHRGQQAEQRRDGEGDGAGLVHHHRDLHRRGVDRGHRPREADHPARLPVAGEAPRDVEGHLARRAAEGRSAKPSASAKAWRISSRSPWLRRLA